MAQAAIHFDGMNMINWSQSCSLVVIWYVIYTTARRIEPSVNYYSVLNYVSLKVFFFFDGVSLKVILQELRK